MGANFMAARHRWWTLGAVALAVAACGGGGGDSGSSGVVVPTGVRSGTASAGADVTQANATGFVGVMARSVLGAADGNVPVLSSERESPQARLTGTAAKPGVLRFAADMAARSLTGAAAREQAQAVTVETLNCTVSGTVTVTADDADNNLRVSRGDSFSFVFTNCVLEVGLPAANGTFAFTVNAVELDAQEEPTALDATITLTGFAEAGFGSMSGSFRVWYRDESATSTRQRVSYLDTNVAEQGQNLVYSFDVYGVAGTTGGSFDLNGALSVGGQAYAMSSTQFTHGAGTLPASGVVTLRDAAGDAVIVRARSTTTFDLEFQAAGAATPTVLSAGLLWSAYRLGN